MLPNVTFAGDAANAQPLADTSDRRAIPPARWSQLVIEVSGNKLEPDAPRQVAQDQEQGQRIRPTRCGDEQTLTAERQKLLAFRIPEHSIND
jgi:hypothetical protein